MWHVAADVKTAEDLKLPVPAIAPRPSDGKRDVETVVLQPTRSSRITSARSQIAPNFSRPGR